MTLTLELIKRVASKHILLDGEHIPDDMSVVRCTFKTNDERGKLVTLTLVSDTLLDVEDDILDAWFLRKAYDGADKASEVALSEGLEAQ